MNTLTLSPVNHTSLNAWGTKLRQKSTLILPRATLISPYLSRIIEGNKYTLNKGFHQQGGNFQLCDANIYHVFIMMDKI